MPDVHLALAGLYTTAVSFRATDWYEDRSVAAFAPALAGAPLVTDCYLPSEGSR